MERQTIKNAKAYLELKDSEKSKLVDFMKGSGISFQQWVNFAVNGSFDQEMSP